MYRKVCNLFLAGSVTLIGGCDKTRETLGLKREQPDEFQVIERRPLSVPPGYALRPPVPGEQMEDFDSPRQVAEERLANATQGSKKSQGKGSKSSGEKALLAEAHTDAKEAEIRENLKDEIPLKKKAPGEDLIFWKKNKKGDVIDPKAENLKYNGKEMPGEMTPAE